MIDLPSVPLAASLNLANSTVNRLTNVFTADLDLSLISRKANLSKLSGFFFRWPTDKFGWFTATTAAKGNAERQKHGNSLTQFFAEQPTAAFNHRRLSRTAVCNRLGRAIRSSRGVFMR